MRSVFFRSFLLTALVILLSLLVLGVAFLSMASGYIAQERRAQLDNTSDMVSEFSKYYLSSSTIFLNRDFRLSINFFGQTADATVLILGADGLVMACSEIYCVHLDQTVSSDVLQKIRHNETLLDRDLSGLFSDARITSARTLKNDTGRIVGYVLVTAASVAQTRLLMEYFRIFLLASAVVLLFAFISTYWASLRMTRPLKMMVIASQSFARGDFSIRIPTRKNKRHETEIDELASAFNAMANALQKAEELRSGFIANVSHELKTPMTTISGFINGIIDGTIPPEKQPAYLSSIREEVLRLSRLVSHMLDLTRLQSGRKTVARVFDVTELLRRILLSFEHSIEEKEMAVEVDIPDEAVPVRADPDAVTQVLYNLMDNAVKYGRPGGQLGVGLAKKAGKLHIYVRNEGPDIPPEDLPYVFERFHKADKSRGVDRASLGLGLYIVKTILGGMKEDIAVKSQNGVTEFAFTLTEYKK